MATDRNPLKMPAKNNVHSLGKSYWLYGHHAVKMAANNPLRKLERLLATPSALQNLGPLPKTCPPPQTIQSADLSKLLAPGAVHQGVAAKVHALKPVSFDQFFSNLGDNNRYPIVVLDQVTDPRNVGAILRSTAAFRGSAIIMQQRHAPEESGIMAKAASGALDLVPIVRVPNLSRALQKLASLGYWVIGLDHDGQSPLHSSPLNKPVALVLGGEGKGLRRLTRQSCDVLSKIEIQADIGSLNVSISAAIALYELDRRG